MLTAPSALRYEQGYGCLFLETEEELAYILAKDVY